MAILKIRDENGNMVEVPAIQGKSAYQYAKEGGYQGTEAEFTQLLGELDSEIEKHNQDELAHPDIREEISQLSSEIADKEQLKPEFAQTIEECTDTSKLYVLPDGYIYAYMRTRIETHPNMFDPSVAVLNKRLNSSGVESNAPGCFITDYLSIDAAASDSFVFRITPFVNTIGNNSVHFYDASKNRLGMAYLPNQAAWGSYNDGTLVADLFQNKSNVSSETVRNAKYIRVSLNTGNNESNMKQDAIDDVVITFDSNVAYEDTYQWANTGHAFVPADYEGRIVELENEVEEHEKRLMSLEANENVGIPSYWLTELETKANAIQRAVENAGCNKSAFLWYTDAHWQSNSKMSPTLLQYLIENTPINKVNFGGDIINDPSEFTHDNIKYAYEWRKLVANIPNHHSVIGNHDNFQRAGIDADVSKLAYAFLLAAEETPDMVKGGDFYYYIDNFCEKTRYLYLDSGRLYLDEKEMQFIIDTLTSTPIGWHIVVISHIWFQYTSSSNPTVGDFNSHMQVLLNVLDAYNNRESGTFGLHYLPTKTDYFKPYDFTNCGGKVEFCIGGHIHVDYDLTSNGGIPIIITASDTNQERSGDEQEDCGTVGTITESAVYGIVADYDNNKINIIGIGRGGSRIVTIN